MVMVDWVSGTGANSLGAVHDHLHFALTLSQAHATKYEAYLLLLMMSKVIMPWQMSTQVRQLRRMSPGTVSAAQNAVSFSVNSQERMHMR